MRKFDPRPLMMRARWFVVAVSASVVVGVTLLAAGGDARSTNPQAAAQAHGFVPVCVQRKGGKQSMGDLNILLRRSCAKHQKPLKLALFPVAPSGPGPAGPQGPPGPGGPLVPLAQRALRLLVSTVWPTCSSVEARLRQASGRRTRRRWAHRSVPRREESSALRVQLRRRPARSPLPLQSCLIRAARPWFMPGS